MNFFSFYLSSAIKGNNIKDAVKLIKNNNNLLDDFILYDVSNIIYPIQLAVKHGQYKVLVALINSGVNLKCYIRAGNSDNLDLMNYAIFNYGKAYQDSETTMREKDDRYKIIKDLSNFFDVTKYFTYINKLDLAVKIDLYDRMFLDRLINIYQAQNIAGILNDNKLLDELFYSSIEKKDINYNICIINIMRINNIDTFLRFSILFKKELEKQIKACNTFDLGDKEFIVNFFYLTGCEDEAHKYFPIESSKVRLSAIAQNGYKYCQSSIINQQISQLQAVAEDMGIDL